MTKKIAILETIHESGIKALEKLGQVDRLEGMARADLLKKIAPYDVVIIKSNIKIDDEFVAAAENLKIVGRGGVGTDNIDQDLLASKNITLITTPSGNTVSTAEFTVAMILQLARRLPEVTQAIQNNDFRRHLYEGREISKLNIGLFGLGNVGMSVARRLSPFGCKLYGCDRTMRRQTIFEDLGGTMVNDLPDMLSELDVLSIHASLNEHTHGLLDKAVLKKLRPGCIIINTARGAIINQDDLIAALDSGHIAAAALDVIDPEPPYNIDPKDNQFSHPLLNHPKIVYTPHLAASTRDAQIQISIDLADAIQKNLTESQL